MRNWQRRAASSDIGLLVGLGGPGTQPSALSARTRFTVHKTRVIMPRSSRRPVWNTHIFIRHLLFIFTVKCHTNQIRILFTVPKTGCPIRAVTEPDRGFRGVLPHQVLCLALTAAGMVTVWVLLPIFSRSYWIPKGDKLEAGGRGGLLHQLTLQDPSTDLFTHWELGPLSSSVLYKASPWTVTMLQHQGASLNFRQHLNETCLYSILLLKENKRQR